MCLCYVFVHVRLHGQGHVLSKREITGWIKTSIYVFFSWDFLFENTEKKKKKVSCICRSRAAPACSFVTGSCTSIAVS